MAVTDQAVVETAADALGAHDLERLSALLHEDVVFRAPGDRLLMLEQLGLAHGAESGP